MIVLPPRQSHLFLSLFNLFDCRYRNGFRQTGNLHTIKSVCNMFERTLLFPLPNFTPNQTKTYVAKNVTNVVFFYHNEIFFTLFGEWTGYCICFTSKYNASFHYFNKYFF